MSGLCQLKIIKDDFIFNLIIFSNLSFEIFVLDNHCAHVTSLQTKDQT